MMSLSEKTPGIQHNPKQTKSIGERITGFFAHLFRHQAESILDENSHIASSVDSIQDFSNQKNKNIQEKQELLYEIFAEKGIEKNEILEKNIRYISTMSYRGNIFELIKKSNRLGEFTQKDIGDIYSQVYQISYMKDDYGFIFVWGEKYIDLLKLYEIYDVERDFFINNIDKSYEQLVEIFKHSLEKNIGVNSLEGINTLFDYLNRQQLHKAKELYTTVKGLGSQEEIDVFLFYLQIIEKDKGIDITQKMQDAEHLIQSYKETLEQIDRLDLIAYIVYLSLENHQTIDILFFNHHNLFDSIKKDSQYKFEKIQYLAGNCFVFNLESIEITKEKLKDEVFFERKHQIFNYFGDINLNIPLDIELSTENIKILEKILKLQNVLSFSPSVYQSLLEKGKDNIDYLLNILQECFQIQKNNDIFSNSKIGSHYFSERLLLQKIENPEIDMQGVYNLLGDVYTKNLITEIVLKGDFSFGKEDVSKIKDIGKIFHKYSNTISYGESFLYFDKGFFDSIDVVKFDNILYQISISENKNIFQELSIKQIYESMAFDSYEGIIHTIDTSIRTTFENRATRINLFLNILFSKKYDSKLFFYDELQRIILIFDDTSKHVDEFSLLAIAYLLDLDAETQKNDIQSCIDTYDKDSFLDSLEVDPEMTMLNFGFFLEKTETKRSDYDTWKDFLFSSVQMRREKNNERIIDTISKNIPNTNSEAIEREAMLIDENYSGTVNISPEVLDIFLQTGELKSLWELDTEFRNIKYKYKRDKIESRMGYATDIGEENMEHIIYGGFVTQGSLKNTDKLGAAPGYGKIGNAVYLKIKKEKVKNDCLFCIDDSFADYFGRRGREGLEQHYGLGVNGLAVSQVDLVGAKYGKTLQKYNGHRGEFGEGINYVEMNIFNGLTINDIDGIYIQDVNDYKNICEKFPQFIEKLFLIQ